MKLDYENFADVLSRPKFEKKDYNRNNNQEGEGKGENTGFERR